jgi:transposase-like protein
MSSEPLVRQSQTEKGGVAMADAHNLSADALVRKVLTDDHADLVREAVSFLCHQIMEAEVTARIGAGLGERAPDERSTHRNGYRERRWDTRAGTVELFIPKVRAGSYFPSFLEPRTRAEQALVAVVMETYVNGVSTRKIERVVEQLGVAGMSKSAVPRMCATLDAQVTAFRERPLEGAYPYLWLDAKVERVRDPDGRVRRKALVVAYAVHEAGYREVIALDVGATESTAFWRQFLRLLVARGLSGVELVVSDQHEGLKAAIGEILGCPWQRCTVHFLRGTARPRPPWPAGDDRRGAAAGLPSDLARGGPPGLPGGDRAPGGRGTQGRGPAHRRRRRSAGLPRTARRALAQAAQHQPLGARQPGDRPQD